MEESFLQKTKNQIFNIEEGKFIDNISHGMPAIDFSSNNIHDFLTRNIRYPAIARREGVEGWVVAKLHLEKGTAKILSIKLINDIGAECGDEVTRVLSQTPPHILNKIETNKEFLLLPVGFGLGSPARKMSKTITEEGTELLQEVLITAIGIERDRKVKVDYGSAKNSTQLESKKAFSFKTALKSKAKIEEISIVNEGIKLIPREIGDIQGLRFLDLENNRIIEIPKELTQLSSLRELHLSGNNLRLLPQSFNNLDSLRILGLANNIFAEFPLQITKMERLEALDLSNNGISVVPNEIEKMIGLKLLWLANNTLESLPIGIYSLKNLNKLFLEGNPLNEQTISRLKKELKKTEIFFDQQK